MKRHVGIRQAAAYSNPATSREAKPLAGWVLLILALCAASAAQPAAAKFVSLCAPELAAGRSLGAGRPQVANGFAQASAPSGSEPNKSLTLGDVN